MLSTGGGNSGITADVSEALSAEAAEVQQVAAQGDGMQQAAEEQAAEEHKGGANAVLALLPQEG